MNIRIRIKAENADAIFEEGMNYIDWTAKDRPQWKKHEDHGRYYYETECDISVDDIIAALRELTAKYPELDIYAECSYSIREDDSSAQWWRTTRIKSKRDPKGTATLDIDSGTYWF